MAYTAFNNIIFTAASANTLGNKLVQAVIDEFGAVPSQTEFLLSGCVADYFQEATTNTNARTISFVTNQSAIYEYFVGNVASIINTTNVIAYADRIQITTPEGYKVEIWKLTGSLTAVNYGGVYLQEESEIPAALKNFCSPGTPTGDETPMVLGNMVFNPGGSTLFSTGWKIFPGINSVQWRQGDAVPPARTLNLTIKNYSTDSSYTAFENFEVRPKVSANEGQGLQAPFASVTIDGGNSYALAGNSLTVDALISFINLGVLDAGSYSASIDFEVWAETVVSAQETLIETRSTTIVLVVSADTAANVSPTELVFEHVLGEPVPPGQLLTFDIQGTYAVFGAKFFTFSGASFQDVSTSSTTGAQATGPAKLNVLISSAVEALGVGFHEETLTVFGSNGIQVKVNINIADSQNIQVTPTSLYFEATKGVQEASPQKLTINSPFPYTFVVPDWLLWFGVGNDRFMDPVNTDSFSPGTYTGEIVMVSQEGEVRVPVTYKINANGFTDLLADHINFTKDQIDVNYASTLFKTYIRANYYIVYYDSNAIGSTVRHIADIPIFDGKGAFHPGTTLNGLLPNLTQLMGFALPWSDNVNRVFNYFQSAVVRLTLEERYLNDDSLQNTVILDDLLFQKGRSPENFKNSIGVSMANAPLRVTKNSYAMFNFYRDRGIHTIELTKNGSQLQRISHTAIESSGYGMLLSMADHKEGDLIYASITAPDGTQYQRGYFMLPEGKESYHIAWATENEQLEIMEFTGGFGINSEYEQIQNRKYVNLVDVVDILETRKTQRVVANTGWVMKSNFEFIDSLTRAKRAWLILDGHEKEIAMVPQTNAQSNYDSDRALYEYDVEFLINPDHDSEVYSR